MAVEAVHRLSLDQYHGMIEAGLFGEKDRVEFIEGVIVDMSPKGREHELAILWLAKLFYGALDQADWDVRIASSLTIGNSEPEPDVAVVAAGTETPYHPATAALVIEVAVSSQRRDLITKRPLYAGAAVDEYWVVDLDARRVVVHRDPADGDYRSVETVTDGELSALGVPVDVAALLSASAA